VSEKAVGGKAELSADLVEYANRNCRSGDERTCFKWSEKAEYRNWKVTRILARYFTARRVYRHQTDARINERIVAHPTNACEKWEIAPTFQHLHWNLHDAYTGCSSFVIKFL